MAEAGGFPGLVARAELRSASGDWAEAAELWARVTAANPVHGDYWGRLAEAEFAREEFAAARAAYERALELGLRAEYRRPGEDELAQLPGDVAYRIACCEARLGRRDEAIEALGAALDRGFRYLALAREDNCWKPWRGDARVRELLGLVDAGSLSRAEGWRGDLRFLAREIKRLAYAPFALASEDEFDRLVADLDGAIPDLTDAQILVGMMKLVRHLDDGHAGVRPPEGENELSLVLPLDLFLFPEGLYVIGAGPGYQDLLGARVEKIGRLTVQEAFAALDPVIVRDNPQQVTFMVPRFLCMTAVLRGLGLADEADRASLTVRGADGASREVVVNAGHGGALWDRYPAGWTSLADTVLADTLPADTLPAATGAGGPASRSLPLHLRHRELPYWFEYLPGPDLVYFQFNAVRDHPAEPFAAFCDRLFAVVGDRHTARLVIDLRWNGGGNTFLTRQLLHHLIACPQTRQRGSLFVIIGRQTFSAAQNTATAIGRETNAIFAGEPTGSRPNFIGETIYFELPYSKVRANAADLFWQTSWPTDYRTWIAPDLYAPPTFAAWSRNEDPAMDAILSVREQYPGS